jgi:coiled-coil domain-containing protein 41
MDANELMRKITHLETEITEHRMRSDAFKTNFERIKSEHARVQQENDRLQRELTEHRENWRATEDRFQDTVAQERKEKDVLLAECEELRSQVMTPHRLELLKHQIAEDLARTHKERLDVVEQELESYKRFGLKINIATYLEL